MPKRNKTPRHSENEESSWQGTRTPCPSHRNIFTPGVKSGSRRASFSSHKKAKVTPSLPRVMALPLRPGKRDSQALDDDDTNCCVGLNTVIDQCASIRLNSAQKGSPMFELYDDKENNRIRSPCFIARRRMSDMDDTLEHSPAPLLRCRSSQGTYERPPKRSETKRRRTRSSSLTEVLSELGVLENEELKPTARLCAELLKRASKSGIKVLALDWDCTVIQCHTRGSWYGTARDLVPHVRPFFRYLIQTAPKFSIHVAIVTFSGQTSLVHEVMKEIALPSSGYSIRCCDDTWDAADHIETLFPSVGICGELGKLPHIASVLREINDSELVNFFVPPTQVLLVDDDYNNIEIAHKTSVPAIHFDVDDPMSVANSMCELFEELEQKSQKENLPKPSHRRAVSSTF